MKYLLDTNTCIRFLNGQSDNVRRMRGAASPDQVALCSIVRAELLYGALKSTRPERNVERWTYFFKGLPCLPFNGTAIETYALSLSVA